MGPHRDVQSVHANYDQVIRDDLDRKPPSLLEAVSLLLGDEIPPNIQILHGPLVRPLQKDVVRHNVIVAKGGYDRHHQRTGWALGVVFGSPKDLGEFRNDMLILLDDLGLRARDLLVIVVAGGIAGPDDEVDVVAQMFLHPLERLVDQT